MITDLLLVLLFILAIFGVLFVLDVRRSILAQREYVKELKLMDDVRYYDPTTLEIVNGKFLKLVSKSKSAIETIDGKIVIENTYIINDSERDKR